MTSILTAHLMHAATDLGIQINSPPEKSRRVFRFASRRPSSKTFQGKLASTEIAARIGKAENYGFMRGDSHIA